MRYDEFVCYFCVVVVVIVIVDFILASFLSLNQQGRYQTVHRTSVCKCNIFHISFLHRWAYEGKNIADLSSRRCHSFIVDVIRMLFFFQAGIISPVQQILGIRFALSFLCFSSELLPSCCFTQGKINQRLTPPPSPRPPHRGLAPRGISLEN